MIQKKFTLQNNDTLFFLHCKVDRHQLKTSQLHDDLYQLGVELENRDQKVPA